MSAGRRLVRTLVLAVTAAALSGCSRNTEDYVRSGDAFVAKDQFREAVIEYRNAVQQVPNSGTLRLKLADAYERAGDYPNASREYVRGADLLPADAAAQLKAARFLLLARKYDDARARAERVLAREPKHVDALVLRANALAGLKQFDAAIADMEEAISAAPDRSLNYANLGTLQMVRGDTVQAEAAFRQAVDIAPRSVEARLALANYLWAAGRRDAARDELQVVLEIDPKHTIAHRAMALYHLGGNRPADAEAHLKIVAEEVPGGRGTLALADFYVRSGRPDQARHVLEMISPEDAKTFATARIRLAALGFGSGDRIAAKRLVDEALTADGRNTEALIGRARLLLDEGRKDEALAAARDAVASDSRSARAHVALGRVLAGRGDVDGAIGAFTDALSLNPGLVSAEFELARLNSIAGRYDAALQHARSVIARNPRVADAYLVLATAALRKGDTKEAEAAIQVLAKGLPESPAVQARMGQLHVARKDLVAARAAFERALALDPANLEALTGLTRIDLALPATRPAARARLERASLMHPADSRVLVLAGTVHASLREFADAERSLEAALVADPDNLQAYALLGQIYAAQGQLPAAITQLAKAVERRPDSVPHVTSLGVLLEMANREDEAMNTYEKALALDPRAAVAANNLAWIHARRGNNLDVALQLAQMAKVRLPDHPAINDTLGFIYYRKGLPSMALPALLQSVEREPGRATYHYHLGLVYAAQGDDQRARASLERALGLDSSFQGSADARRMLASLDS